jgi:hypothetical protein
VTFDPARVTTDQLIQAIDKLGFRAFLKAARSSWRSQFFGSSKSCASSTRIGLAGSLQQELTQVESIQDLPSRSMAVISTSGGTPLRVNLTTSPTRACSSTFGLAALNPMVMPAGM